jgi:hypothetical protein
VDRTVVLPRSRSARILAVTLAAVLLTVLLTAVLRNGAAEAARHAPAAEQVLTLRYNGTVDALWLVSAEGTATAVGTLPGVAEEVAVSPDGSTAAYMPFASKPFVWIGYSPAGQKTIPLAAAGVKTLTGLTWTSNDQLLISGSKKANDATGYSDRLYTVDVATGAVTPFRNLSGTNADASPDTGKIVYVRWKKLDNGTRKYPEPKYRESLMLTSLTGTGAGKALDEQEFRMGANYNPYTAPRLSPAGDWIAYGTTGSDVSVTYHVAYLGDGFITPWFDMWMPTPIALEWAPASPLLALGGAAVGPGSDAGMYVADAAGGAMGRTAKDLFTKAAVEWILDMDWSDGGKIVVDGLDKNAGSNADAEFHVLLLDGADLSKATDLGLGHLSAWVR